jgi:hypothetical protein
MRGIGPLSCRCCVPLLRAIGTRDVGALSV